MTETPSSAPANGAADTPPGMMEDLRSLRRSRDNRVVAGVLGGLGRRFGVDPLIFRVLTAVLALFGGVGILLYAVAWLLIPAEDERASVLDQAIGRDEVRDVAAVPLALALGAVVLISSGVVFGASWNGPILLLLAAVGGYMLLRRRSDDASGQPAQPTGWEPPSSGWEWTAATGAAPSADTPAGATSGTTLGDDTSVGTDGSRTMEEPAPAPGEEPVPGSDTRPGPVEAGADTQPADAAWSPLGAAPDGAGAGWPEGPDWDIQPPHAYGYTAQPAEPEPAPVETKKPRSVLGVLTFCAAVIALGVVAIIDAAASVPPALYFAAPLAVVALGLLIGTWYGRSRGLIALGILLTLLLVPATLISDWDLSSGPQRMVAGPAVASLPAEPVTHGAGPLDYDLTALELTDDDEVSITVQLGAGPMTIVVPETADVVVTGSVGLGSIEVFDSSWAGFALEQQITDDGPDGPGGGQIELDLEVGVGVIEVTRDTAEVAR